MPRLIIGLLALLLSLAFHAASAPERPVVTIDAGHGGEQAGVVIGDIIEKDVVLRAAFAFAEEFAARGYDANVTRTGDQTIGFHERTDIAEASGSFLMISLHTNRSDADSVHGLVIFPDLDNPPTAAVAPAFDHGLGTALKPARSEERMGPPWSDRSSFPPLSSKRCASSKTPHPITSSVRPSNG